MKQDTKNEIVLGLFKMLVAGFSMAISLPAAINANVKNYSIFILTIFVFVFGKLIDSLESFFCATDKFYMILYGIGCIIGLLFMIYSLYFMGAVFNSMNSSVALYQFDDINYMETLKEYPLLGEKIMWNVPIVVSAYYVLLDLFCVLSAFLKYHFTKKCIYNIKKVL